MTSTDEDSTVERILGDLSIELDLVDVVKLLRTLGFGLCFRDDRCWDIANLDEQVTFSIQLQSWRVNPVAVVGNLRREIVESWLVGRRADGLPPLSFDKVAYRQMVDSDRFLRRRLSDYV